MDSETVREVSLTPTKDWGGQGLLGCDVSFGYFNKIPLRQKDLDRSRQKHELKNVFGRLTGDASSNLQGPTSKMGSERNSENVNKSNNQDAKNGSRESSGNEDKPAKTFNEKKKFKEDEKQKEGP